MVVDLARLFLFRAEESLAGADSEFDNGRYNNCANRSYYACFQAAICALMRAGIGTSGRSGQWGMATSKHSSSGSSSIGANSIPRACVKS